MPALMATTTGCLVTSVPEYDDPQRTAPFLVAASAVPDLREVFELKTAPETPEKYPDLTIEANLLSEDAGAEVVLRFYLDYGVDTGNGLPFQDDFFAARMPPGTLADGPRKVRANFRPPSSLRNQAGCHTLTLIASHDFTDETNCPASLADSSQITWRFVACPDTMSCIEDLMADKSCLPSETPLLSCPPTSGGGS